jgi:hypothetical protein
VTLTPAGDKTQVTRPFRAIPSARLTVAAAPGSVASPVTIKTAGQRVTSPFGTGDGDSVCARQRRISGFCHHFPACSQRQRNGTPTLVTLAALTERDRERLLARVAELRELDKLMRQPGTLATPRQGQDDTETAAL